MQFYWAKGRAGVVSYFSRCAHHLRDSGRRACRSADRRGGLRANEPAEEIEAAAWTVVDQILRDPTAPAAAVEASRDAETDLVPVTAERISQHQRRLAKARLALTRLRRLFLEEDIEEATHRHDKGEYDRQLEMLRDELVRMQAAEARRQQPRAPQDKLHDPT